MKIPNSQFPIPNQIPMSKCPLLKIRNWSLVGHWSLVIGNLILFFVLYSLFFAVVPVFAAETTPAASCAATEATLKEEKYRGPDFSASKILPLCVYFEGTDLEKTCGCRNINVFVSLLTKFATWLFGIVGAAALVVFVYGGFTILTAAGSAERVKKGKDALIAAVIGLIIIFGAQVGLRFLVKSVLPAEGQPGAYFEEGKGLQMNVK